EADRETAEDAVAERVPAKYIRPILRHIFNPVTEVDVVVEIVRRDRWFGDRLRLPVPGGVRQDLEVMVEGPNHFGLRALDAVVRHRAPAEIPRARGDTRR